MGDNRVNIRELVAEILLSVDKGEEHSHILLKNVLDKYDYLARQDKSFIKRVTEGTLEYRIKIDYIINSVSKTPVNKMKPIIRQIMRMSVYQLLYMDKVPDRAVCDEAVKLAGKRGFKGLQGFVNGVLRNISRSKDSIKMPSIEDGEVYALSVRYSCPELIVSSLIDDYGVSVATDILSSYLEKRRLFVRIDEAHGIDKLDAIIGEWEEHNIAYKVSDELDYMYELSNLDGIGSLECFSDGLYTVQDVSSAMVCERAGIKPGDIILDMCAAPGGKTLHAAAKLSVLPKEATGHVDSRDVSEYKTMLIDENVSRMGYEDVVGTSVVDATVFDIDSEDKYDVVICDIPCSGFGVIGKKPDIKLNASKESLDSLAELQHRILDNAVRYVKRGGTLMFSTCTLRKAENESNVDYILSSGDYSLAESETIMPTDGHDGFFIAKLTRIG